MLFLTLERKQKKFFKFISNSHIFLFLSYSFEMETINFSYIPVVPSKTIPDSRLKWAKCIPVFRAKQRKNPTRWGGTCLFGLYKGAPPPPGNRKNSRYSHCFCLLGVQTKFIQQIKSIMQIIPFRQTHTNRTERSKTIPWPAAHPCTGHIKEYPLGITYELGDIWPRLSLSLWLHADTTLIGPALYCSYEHLSSRVLLTLELFQELTLPFYGFRIVRRGLVPVLFQNQRIFIHILSQYCQPILGIGI